jgi:hypothetical protein
MLHKRSYPCQFAIYQPGLSNIPLFVPDPLDTLWPCSYSFFFSGSITNKKGAYETDSPWGYNYLLKMEYWSDGVMQKTESHRRAASSTPILQYSSIPKATG